MGPYCQYCDRRCFVDDPRMPGHIIATCLQGMEHDKKILGYSWHDIRLEKKAAPTPEDSAEQECVDVSAARRDSIRGYRADQMIYDEVRDVKMTDTLNLEPLLCCAECGHPARYHERTKDSAEMGVCWEITYAPDELRAAIDLARFPGPSFFNDHLDTLTALLDLAGDYPALTTHGRNAFRSLVADALTQMAL